MLVKWAPITARESCHLLCGLSALDKLCFLLYASFEGTRQFDMRILPHLYTKNCGRLTPYNILHIESYFVAVTSCRDKNVLQ